jgi:hypothetical protein
MPQPNAHIGANQVTGLSSSTIDPSGVDIFIAKS